MVSPTTSPTGQVPATPLPWLLTFCALTLLLFQARRMYVPPLRLELIEVARLVLAGTALAVVLTMAARVLLANDPYVAAETVRHGLWRCRFCSPAAPACCGARPAPAARAATRRTLIVGAGHVGS